MNEPRIIKKYPNRRLYDTKESRYITLADIKKLVEQDLSFVVIDKKTSRNITTPILLQVISEDENQATAPMLSEAYLCQIIRSFQSPRRDIVASYLEQSLRAYLDQDQSQTSAWPTLATTSSTEEAPQAAISHFKRWQQAQDQIYRTLASVGQVPQASSSSSAATSAPQNLEKTAV